MKKYGFALALLALASCSMADEPKAAAKTTAEQGPPTPTPEEQAAADLARCKVVLANAGDALVRFGVQLGDAAKQK